MNKYLKHLKDWLFPEYPIAFDNHLYIIDYELKAMYDKELRHETKIKAVKYKRIWKTI